MKYLGLIFLFLTPNLLFGDNYVLYGENSLAFYLIMGMLSLIGFGLLTQMVGDFKLSLFLSFVISVIIMFLLSETDYYILIKGVLYLFGLSIILPIYNSYIKHMFTNKLKKLAMPDLLYYFVG